MIPYKIHHIWFQGEIPKEYRSNYDKWGEFLSDWEHNIWNESSLLELCSTRQKRDYQRLKTFIDRFNYLKYILMFREGGVFADLYTYPIKNLYPFFVEGKIHDINLQSLLSFRYPFNTEIPDYKPFGDYEVIIPARKMLLYYPNGKVSVMLDNYVLMSTKRNLFWLNLIEWYKDKNSIKNLFEEPYRSGSYELTDFVFNNYANPYKEGILILPETYFNGWDKEPNENMYIYHQKSII
ncbi:MAG TPA: hypothetical protein P5513_04990 [Candidatus Diapherotrites archaeon]|nr:hypothetical protein [Candidatus Diapherotrites archaeon]